MLRLFVRSCPRAKFGQLQDRHTAQLTETIASDTIDSAVGYLSLRNELRPWCTYLTLLLIEVSSRVAPIVKRQAKSPTVTAYRVMLSMVSAQDCLRNLAGSKLSITRKALARLNDISEDLNDAYTVATNIPKSIDIGDTVLWSNGKPGSAVVEGAQDVLDIDDWMLDFSGTWQAGDLTDLFSAEDFSLDF